MSNKLNLNLDEELDNESKEEKEEKEEKEKSVELSQPDEFLENLDEEVFLADLKEIMDAKENVYNKDAERFFSKDYFGTRLFPSYKNNKNNNNNDGDDDDDDNDNDDDDDDDNNNGNRNNNNNNKNNKNNNRTPTLPRPLTKIKTVNRLPAILTRSTTQSKVLPSKFIDLNSPDAKIEMLKYYIIHSPLNWTENERNWELYITLVIKQLISYAQRSGNYRSHESVPPEFLQVRPIDDIEIESEKGKGKDGRNKKDILNGKNDTKSWYSNYGYDIDLQKQLRHFWNQSPSTLWERLMTDVPNSKKIYQHLNQENEREIVMNLFKKVVSRILKLRALIKKHPMIYIPRSSANVSEAPRDSRERLEEWFLGFLIEPCKQGGGSKSGKELSKKVKRQVVECEGCGRMIYIESTKTFPVYITKNVAKRWFIFHNQECVVLRKFKEAIRLFVFQAEIRLRVENYQPPETLAEQIEHMLRVKDSVILPDAQPLPQPIVSTFAENRDWTNEDIKLRRETKLAAIGMRKEEEVLLMNRKLAREPDKNYITRMAVSYENKDQENAQDTSTQMQEYMTKDRLDLVPDVLRDLDVYTYGKPLWYFCVHQLQAKDRRSVWNWLIYLGSHLPTAIAIRLLEENREGLSKFRMACLDELCQDIIESSEFPAATSLYLAAFMKDRSINDLSREDEFKQLCQKYLHTSIDLLQQIESDHLLAILLDTPSDIDDMSIFDITLRFRLQEFVEFHRLDPLMLQMWYRVKYLDPKKNFLQVPKNFNHTLRTLIKAPQHFYYSPVGQYIVTGLLYIFYVVYFSIVTLQRIYPYESASTHPEELVLWFLNAGYVSYELLQLILEGRGYLLDVLNYWDICIVIVWVILALMRFILPREGVLSVEYWGSENEETEIDIRNKSYTITYMIFWSIQCVLLWTRTAGIFRNIPSTGSLLTTVLKMMKDVANFFLILIVFTAGFVFAMYYLISTDLTGECQADDSTEALGTLSSVLFYMSQALLGQHSWDTVSSSNSKDCFSSNRSRIAQIILVIYSLLGLIILLNLLIAMMATTFNNATCNARVESKFNRLKTTFELSHRNAIMPPPFNMIVIVVMVFVTILDYCIRWFSGGWYVLSAETLYPIHYSLKYDLQEVQGKSAANEKQWMIQQEQKEKDEYQLETDKKDNNEEYDSEVKNFVVLNESDREKGFADEIPRLNSHRNTLWGKLTKTRSDPNDETFAPVTTPHTSFFSCSKPWDSRPWYIRMVQLLPQKEWCENPLNFSQAVYCRFCRHEMDVDGGDICDYFELFRNYQVLDEMDKDLMKKLSRGHTICSHCFRPYKHDPVEKVTNRLYRWQVLLEILSYYVFMVFIWIPLILLLWIPATISDLWEWVDLISQPQIKSTEMLASAKVELEDVDPEYKAEVNNIIDKNNERFRGEEEKVEGKKENKEFKEIPQQPIQQPTQTQIPKDMCKTKDLQELQTNMENMISQVQLQLQIVSAKLVEIDRSIEDKGQIVFSDDEINN